MATKLKNQDRLTEGEIAHLQMNNAFTTKSFQALLDWQKRDNLFCSECRAIAERIEMKPRGGWVNESPPDRWHKFHDDLNFGGNHHE